MTTRDDALQALGWRLDAIDEELATIGLDAAGREPDDLLAAYGDLVAERERLVHRLEVVARGWRRCKDAECDVCLRERGHLEP